MELFILQIVGVVPPGGSLEVFVPEGVRPRAARVGEGRARHVRLQRRIRKEDRTGREFRHMCFVEGVKSLSVDVRASN